MIDANTRVCYLCALQPAPLIIRGEPPICAHCRRAHLTTNEPN